MVLLFPPELAPNCLRHFTSSLSLSLSLVKRSAKKRKVEVIISEKFRNYFNYSSAQQMEGYGGGGGGGEYFVDEKAVQVENIFLEFLKTFVDVSFLFFFFF